MLFLNLITIKLCILHKYHLPSCCGSAGICHSTAENCPISYLLKVVIMHILITHNYKYVKGHYKKKLWGRTPRRPQIPLSIQLFLFFFFFVAPPHFSAPSYATDIYKYLTDLNITLFEFISVPYENKHQTLNLKKIDRGQRTSVVFMYPSALLSSEKMESQHYNWK